MGGIAPVNPIPAPPVPIKTATGLQKRCTHPVVLPRYPVVLVLVRFLRFPLVRAHACYPVQRVPLDPVARGPYGPAGLFQLVQQPSPGSDHQTAAASTSAAAATRARRRRVSAATAAVLETLRAHGAQRRRVLAIAFQLVGHAPAHRLQQTDFGLLPAHQSLVFGTSLARRPAAAGVTHGPGAQKC